MTSLAGCKAIGGILQEPSRFGGFSKDSIARLGLPELYFADLEDRPITAPNSFCLPRYSRKHPTKSVSGLMRAIPQFNGLLLLRAI